MSRRNQVKEITEALGITVHEYRSNPNKYGKQYNELMAARNAQLSAAIPGEESRSTIFQPARISSQEVDKFLDRARASQFSSASTPEVSGRPAVISGEGPRSTIFADSGVNTRRDITELPGRASVPESSLAVKDSSPGVMRGDGGGIRHNLAGGAALATGAGLYGLSSKEDPEKLEAAKEEPAFRIPMRRPGDPEAPKKEAPKKEAPKDTIGDEAVDDAKKVTGYSPDVSIGRASDEGVNNALQEYKSLADRLESLGLDTSAMDQQMADAASKYEKRRTTSEWAEVAQTLAQAFARYAAADAGLDWTKLDIPTIDYQKRIERDAKERDSEIERAKLSQRSREQVLGLQRDTLRDRLQVAREGIGTEENKRRLEQDLLIKRADLQLRGNELREKSKQDNIRSRDEKRQSATSLLKSTGDELATLQSKIDAVESTALAYLQGDTSAGTLKAMRDFGISPSELEQALDDSDKDDKGEDQWFVAESPVKAAQAIAQKKAQALAPQIQELLRQQREARGVLEDKAGLTKQGTKMEEGAPASDSSPIQISSAADAGKLPPGSKFTLNGKTFKKNKDGTFDRVE